MFRARLINPFEDVRQKGHSTGEELQVKFFGDSEENCPKKRW
jgi:hypothetical protein